MYGHEVKNFKYPVSQFKHRFFLVALVVGYLLSSPTSALSYQFATFVMDAYSGNELHSQNGRVKLHPASLTKMMTLYLAFNEVAQNKIGISSFMASWVRLPIQFILIGLAYLVSKIKS